MNASAVLVLLVVAFLAFVSGFPARDDLTREGLGVQVTDEEFPDLDPRFEVVDEEGETGRFRRATCDLLSVSLPIGSLNHAACAAHCLALRKRYRGGRCKDGVCHCRR